MKHFLFAGFLFSLFISPAYATDKDLRDLAPAAAIDSDDIIACREDAETEDNSCTGAQIASMVYGEEAANLTLAGNGALRGTPVGEGGSVVYIQAWDDDGSSWTTFGTLTSAATPSLEFVNTSITTPNTGLHVLDTNASHDLVIVPGSNLTADRNFTITTGDAARTLDISATDTTISSFAATVLDDTSAANFNTTLGLGTGSSVQFNAETLNTLTMGSGGVIRTGTGAGNVINFQARDVDGAAYTTFCTLTANNTPTANCDLTTLSVGGGTSIGSIVSSTWTPTLTNAANLDASTASECQYIRIGNTVTGSCRVSVDPTTTVTSTQLGISLPVASNFGAVEDAAGSCAATGIAGQSAGIIADATNDRMEMRWLAGDVTNQPMSCSFSYQVI